MPLPDKISPAPREVRVAGAIAALPGFILMAFGFLLLAASFNTPEMTSGVYAQVGYYVVLGLATAACAGGLLLGKTWARSPVVVIALIMIGVGWYVTGPSGQAGFGVPVIIGGVAILVLLFRRPSRAWALGQLPGESEAEASERGGAQGRRAEREKREGPS